jgi:hypothetical protein
MRRYADPVEVRQGPLETEDHGVEGPQQFLWRGRLWKVRAVLAHWVETGPWWQSAGARTAVGSDEPAEPVESAELSGSAGSAAPGGAAPQRAFLGDLLTERELWRVEAARGRLTQDGEPDGGGIFDLAFDWAEGRWTLVGCTD